MAVPRPKKCFGQNFLTDHGILSRIVDSLGIEPGESVLEVGPGRGALTRLLAQKAAHLVAVEVDRQLVPLLQKEFAVASNVTIVEQDILKADLPRLLAGAALPCKVAANLPYNISSQVLFRFLDQHSLFSRLVLMLQKEVGERLLAPPDCKEYGILTILCGLHFDIRREFLVRPGAFHPVPKVDSIVLRFDTLSAPRFPVGEELFFRRLVKTSFAQRRKTLWNCLKGSGLSSDPVLQNGLVNCGIDGGRRGETLSLEEFAALSREILRLSPCQSHP
ncbi:16S rRNA (adenine(1518)-N(6)/adenine(1519)-N(6))-dimethyltransferase RsmA [Geobacter sp. DSM 9736]|uniref:16S rRNA (adenine(1518)-N(6)/adenine(1519)-N(6))- dimethyltransferase RsmA n=1 Tax=Geobacter sp. DSM 9736 TaxID=1277350 RepID=UPI000B50B761|nr:16S rRNA (adenine(1518)-N(6)/adenine(1519)-N(6))-dimethyltransferase RsmA [Geobacter sp. DSM 9736]SNB45887.1 dimethyladenosine transferase [Geobacter sp. DSM 9736]